MEFIGLNSDDDYIEILLPGIKDKQCLPYLWLRENCPCSKCMLPGKNGKGSRIFLLRNLDIDLTPSEVEVNNKDTLTVKWSSGHVSSYTIPWFLKNGLNDVALGKEDSEIFLPQTLWTAKEKQHNLPKFDYTEFLEDNETCLKWLTTLETGGLCILTSAPKELGIIPKICKRICYHRKTHYGNSFEVRSKDNPSNIAYTPAPLGFHADLPYYTYIPSVQLLHCVKQATSGGENIFADSFKVAADMKISNPEFYQVLCDTTLYFSDNTTEDEMEYYLSNRRPLFELDKSGKVERVNHSFQRDALMKIHPSKVKLFYKAMMHFEKMLMDPKYCIEYQLQEGEVVAFHNCRVLHGRQVYTLDKGEERLLEGAYLDWDELRSRRRVLSLEKELAQS